MILLLTCIKSYVAPDLSRSPYHPFAYLLYQRDKAWQHGQYPCVGEWMFLLPFIPKFSQYPRILARAQAGAAVLDLGCCFGQDLRLLAADGAPTHNMYACDIKEELWQLGFELFRDREKMRARFVQADIFDPDSDLVHLSGQMDIIIASQFLHLWDWKRQVLAMKRVVELSRPGAILVGYQRGQVRAQEVMRPWGTMFFHDLDTYREIWHQVEVETSSRWDVEASFVDLRELGMEEEDLEWMPPGQKGINFVVTRLT